MNYVEHHFGDYAKDTAHLSMLEDGAYRRLLDVYYGREMPLPVSETECCRLVRAISAAAKLRATATSRPRLAHLRMLAGRRASRIANRMRTQCERIANA